MNGDFKWIRKERISGKVILSNTLKWLFGLINRRLSITLMVMVKKPAIAKCNF